MFQCEATNKHGTILASANVNVLSESPGLSPPGDHIQHPQAESSELPGACHHLMVPLDWPQILRNIVQIYAAGLTMGSVMCLAQTLLSFDIL